MEQGLLICILRLRNTRWRWYVCGIDSKPLSYLRESLFRRALMRIPFKLRGDANATFPMPILKTPVNAARCMCLGIFIYTLPLVPSSFLFVLLRLWEITTLVTSSVIQHVVSVPLEDSVGDVV